MIELKETELKIAGRECLIFSCEDPEVLVIEPSMGFKEAGEEAEKLKEAGVPFAFAVFRTEDWNRELSPWKAPAVFGNEDFADGAEETLSFIEKDMIPALKKEIGDIPVALGGYSLAGFFALWAAYRTETFSAAAAVSPSVWFPGWIEYASERSPKAKAIYLSLGKKEAKTRNPVMATVADCIEKQHMLLKEAGIECALEWNEGNHFKDPAERTAKGILWCLKNLKEK